MIRSAAWMLGMGLLLLPSAVIAADQTPVPGAAAQEPVAEQVHDYVAGISEAFDQNPHSCFEADEEKPERPDLAGRPQS